MIRGLRRESEDRGRKTEDGGEVFPQRREGAKKEERV